MELSRREQEILARIEDELAADDDGLAAALNPEPSLLSRHSSELRTWLGLAGLLALGLIAVIVVNVLMPDLGPAAFGILTVGVVVPWIFFAHARLRRRDREAGE